MSRPFILVARDYLNLLAASGRRLAPAATDELSFRSAAWVWLVRKGDP